MTGTSNMCVIIYLKTVTRLKTSREMYGRSEQKYNKKLYIWNSIPENAVTAYCV
jgi:hypothetical protein